MSTVLTPVSLLGINKFFSSNAQKFTCLLLRIGIFIKQHSFGNKQAKDFLELADISFIA